MKKLTMSRVVKNLKKLRLVLEGAYEEGDALSLHETLGEIIEICQEFNLDWGNYISEQEYKEATT